MKTTPKSLITFVLSSAVCAAMFAPVRGHAQAFPPIGYDTGPGIILTIDANGFINVTSTGQPPYDNIEDTYIGVINNSSTPLCGLRLQSPNGIFDFDGDGPCGIDPNTGQPFNPSPCSPSNPFGPTRYEGPGVSFNDYGSGTAGTVNFNPPVAQGQSAWFALEEAIQISCSPISGINHLPQGCHTNSSCPSPP